MREAPRVPARSLGGAAASVRDVLTTEGLSLRVLELRSGRCSLRAESEEELLLFVLAGRGLLRSAVGQDPLEPETAVLLAAGEHCELEGSLELVAVGVKAPLEQASGTAVRISRLAEQAAQAATAAREFRIVLDPACGCASATQFVGYIPPGRAPAHFHTYDELIYVLEGEGAMRFGERSTPVSAGSCIELPARTLHTLANSGPGVMRILGTFRPAGSPAAAFYPDGSPASQDAGTKDRASEAHTDRGGST